MSKSLQNATQKTFFRKWGRGDIAVRIYGLGPFRMNGTVARSDGHVRCVECGNKIKPFSPFKLSTWGRVNVGPVCIPCYERSLPKGAGVLDKLVTI